MKNKPFKLQGKKCKTLSNFNEEKNSLIYIQALYGREREMKQNSYSCNEFDI